VIAMIVLRTVSGLGPTQKLTWTPFSAEVYSQAMRSGAPFVIEFSAEWCLPCREMEARTFTDPKVIAAADGVGLLTVDMTTSTQETRRILRSFEVVGAPTILFFGRDGEEHERRIGFVGPREFAELLRSSRQLPAHSDTGGGA
jgi:thiol:disulfide interchange protein DsbD